MQQQRDFFFPNKHAYFDFTLQLTIDMKNSNSKDIIVMQLINHMYNIVPINKCWDAL